MEATIDTMGVLNRVKFEHSQLVAAAEEVLKAKALDPLGVNPEDEHIFKVLGWDERKVARELVRVTNVMRDKEIAGTNPQFAEAVEVAEAYSRSVPTEVAKLDAKIADLQAKRDAEQSKLDSARCKVETMENARSRLRTLLPDNVRTKFERERDYFMVGGLAERFRELRNRRTTIDGILEKLAVVNDGSIRGIVLYCQTHFRDAVPPPDTNPYRGLSIDENIWANHIKELRKERFEIDSELPAIEQEYEQELAAIETILDYYVNGGTSHV